MKTKLFYSYKIRITQCPVSVLYLEYQACLLCVDPQHRKTLWVEQCSNNYNNTETTLKIFYSSDKNRFESKFVCVKMKCNASKAHVSHINDNNETTNRKTRNIKTSKIKKVNQSSLKVNWITFCNSPFSF